MKNIIEHIVLNINKLKNILFLDRIKPEYREAFLNKLYDVCDDLNIHPNLLMFVMMSESGLNPHIVNNISGAIGLIQFMPKTLQGMGLTSNDIKKSNIVTQLDYVKKYFKMHGTDKKNINNVYQLYLLTFFPVALNQINNDDYIFEAKGISRKSIAKQNPAIDKDKKGYITMRDFKNFINRRFVDFVYKYNIDIRQFVPRKIDRFKLYYNYSETFRKILWKNVIVSTSIAFLIGYLINKKIKFV